MKKNLIIFAIILIAVAGISFYAGMQFAPKNNSFANQRMGVSNQARAGQIGPRGNRTGGGFATGEVIAKDDKSVTIKLQDGGSKIVFLTDATPVSKTVSGTGGDVAVGAQVMITGTANSDGSISAQSVQIRPDVVKGN